MSTPTLMAGTYGQIVAVGAVAETGGLPAASDLMTFWGSS